MRRTSRGCRYGEAHRPRPSAAAASSPKADTRPRSTPGLRSCTSCTGSTRSGPPPRSPAPAGECPERTYSLKSLSPCLWLTQYCWESHMARMAAAGAPWYVLNLNVLLCWVARPNLFDRACPDTLLAFEDTLKASLSVPPGVWDGQSGRTFFCLFCPISQTTRQSPHAFAATCFFSLPGRAAPWASALSATGVTFR